MVKSYPLPTRMRAAITVLISTLVVAGCAGVERPAGRGGARVLRQQRMPMGTALVTARPGEQVQQAVELGLRRNPFMPEGALDYWVGGVGRKSGGVKFDGFKSGVLLEAKGPGYANKFLDSLDPKSWFKSSGAAEMVQQANRQVGRVRRMGIPIEWHVAEKRTADAIRKLLKENNISEIEVIHTLVR
ncbi:Tox-REase-5 domain-containing protein [Corallococcus llansteffanensis]|uniref:Tox-REase-5 domain-containing protein n=1 Tax=Corallococcus llansteffanensis TaxID=2316731 RepID=A0A3A8QV05_9BACT|nr:Tox-REase-5 domain-containing protein [Corallococcus llansteffanensis]RKH66944.1 hypothetical protein D7V93_03610 [Corallococcus llansteffanensis]